MYDQTEAAGKKIGFGDPEIRLHALGQPTMDGRNIDPALFKDLPVFHNPGPAPAAFLTFPYIFPELGFPINLLQFGGYGILKGLDVKVELIFYGSLFRNGMFFLLVP